MNKKTEKHLGQLQLNGVSEYDQQTEGLPKGMPPLSAITPETAKLGLPNSDGEHLFNVWLSNGFRTRTGPIKNWKAAIRVWHTNGFFPSQKKQTTKPGELMSYEILDDIAKWTAFKKLDVHKLGAEFKEWCEKNKQPKLVASFIKLLNSRL